MSLRSLRVYIYFMCSPPICIFLASDKNHDLYVDSGCLHMFHVLFFFLGGGVNLLPLIDSIKTSMSIDDLIHH